MELVWNYAGMTLTAQTHKNAAPMDVDILANKLSVLKVDIIYIITQGIYNIYILANNLSLGVYITYTYLPTTCLWR